METAAFFPDEQERWRREVASRVSSYKAKRRRKADFSMNLDFDAGPLSTAETAQLASAVLEQKSSREVCDTNYYRRVNQESMGYGSSSTAVAVAPASLPQEDYDPDFDFLVKKEAARQQEEQRDPSMVEPNTLAAMLETSEAPTSELDATAFVPAVEIPQSTNNVILFPRPSVEPPLAPPPTPRDELAERVFERPRILDVPEDNVPTIQGPLFADIHLDQEADEMLASAQPTQHFEIPLQVAPMVQRAFAGACDWGIVAAATAVFFVLSWKSLGDLPQTRAGVLALAAVPFVFWTVYQFLFNLYAAQTPGMRFAGLRLCDFHHDVPEWEQRKKRAFYTTLSCASVGFGFLWALIDEDTLCWHDRASHTYLTQD